MKFHIKRLEVVENQALGVPHYIRNAVVSNIIFNNSKHWENLREAMRYRDSKYGLTLSIISYSGYSQNKPNIRRIYSFIYSLIVTIIINKNKSKILTLIKWGDNCSFLQRSIFFTFRVNPRILAVIITALQEGLISDMYNVGAILCNSNWKTKVQWLTLNER